MSKLSDYGTEVRDRLSGQHGVSADAVETLMHAVGRGGGTQAQFSHPDLGGMGQWSAGGMTMVGDMFNTSLQARVASLCADIAAAYFQGGLFERRSEPTGQAQSQAQGGASLHIPGGHGEWWPDELGRPSSAGSQNNLSYAIFPASRRLAVNLNGRVTVYDTGDHSIGGISQQQSGDASWTFTSQHGTVHLDTLPVVSPGAGEDPAPARAADDSPADAPPRSEGQARAEARQAHTRPGTTGGQAQTSDEIFAALEKLGSLRDLGVLTDDEFQAKKTELLARL